MSASTYMIFWIYCWNIQRNQQLHMSRIYRIFTPRTMKAGLASAVNLTAFHAFCGWRSLYCHRVLQPALGCCCGHFGASSGAFDHYQLDQSRHHGGPWWAWPSIGQNLRQLQMTKKRTYYAPSTTPILLLTNPLLWQSRAAWELLMVFKLFELSHVTCRGALFRKWIDVTLR